MRGRTRQPAGLARVKSNPNLLAAFYSTQTGLIASAMQPWAVNTTSPTAGRTSFLWRGHRYGAQSGGISSDGFGIKLQRVLGANSNVLSFACLVYFPQTANGSISVCNVLAGDFFALGFHNRGGTGLNEFNVSMRAQSGAYYAVATGETALKPRFAVARLRADGPIDLWVDGAYVGSTTHARGGFNTFYAAPTYVSAIATNAAHVAVGYVWDRWISDSEIQALSRDPFMLLDSGDAFNGIDAATVSGGTYQYARPSADTTTTGWASTGASLYGVTDETTYDDADYAYSTTLGATCEIDLSAVSDPAVHTGHTIRYRARSQYGGTAWFELSEGMASVATWTQVLTTNWATYTYTLSSGEATSISDYGNLAIRIKPI